MTRLESRPAEHVYVHVPFCGRRCSYCDFAIAVRREVPWQSFSDAILAEMVTRQVSLDPDRLQSIYLGGGTPSKLGGEGLAALLSGFAQRIGVDDLSTIPAKPEVTIEVNPEDVSPGAVELWVAAGVNRASVGVQSFQPDVLHWMHREHSAADAERAVRTLRTGGISNLSVDLIFAVPESLGRDWPYDLESVLALEPDHLSLYGLTVEPRTPLGKWTSRGQVREAPEERFESEFLEAHDRLGRAGFEHYEVSNYGRPGRRSRHNSAYWSGVPYLGFGPAAHGFDGHVRRWNASAYAEWSRRVRGGIDPIDGSEQIGENERLAESIYLGLRTTDGLAIRQSELKMVSDWIEAGWGTLTQGVLRLTPLGWLRLDSLAATLTSLRSRS